MFNLGIGSGLGVELTSQLAFGLGLNLLGFNIEIAVEPIYAPGPGARGGGGGGGGKGEERRTYLFIPKTVIFNVGFRGRIYESHFNIPNVAGKILARKMPLLVKAKRTKDGLN